MIPISHSESSTRCSICCCPCSVITNKCSFLTSKYGLIKILEILVLLLAIFLVYDVGKSSHKRPLRDEVYYSFSAAINMAFFQTFTLIVVYILSEKAFRLVRSSFYEIVSNSLIVILFIYCCFFVAFKSNFFTDPLRFLKGRDDETTETLLYVRLSINFKLELICFL